MKWNKLEYGNWPKGKIALRIVSNNGYFVDYEIGEIEINNFNHETYFIQCKDGLHKVISIDSIFDTEPHYIELDNLEVPS